MIMSTMEFRIEFNDFPNTRDFISVVRSFTQDKKKIYQFYQLLKKVNQSPNNKDVQESNVMEYVSFSYAMNSDELKIRMTFD